MADTPPDIILSGINRGANLVTETVFSGTVGAAMTGMLLGVRSIALSQAFTDRANVRWETARKLAPDVIRQLADFAWSHDACLNINFPDCAPEEAGSLMFTRQGHGLLDGIGVVTRADPRGLDYHWLELKCSEKPDHPETETAALASGHISVTPLRFERTHDGVWKSLNKQIEMLDGR